MKKIFLIIAASILTFLNFNCQKAAEFSLENGSNTVLQKAPITASLQGYIVNEQGLPIGSTLVRVGNETVTTDVDGYFRKDNISLDANATVVTATVSGYFKAVRTFSAQKGLNKVFIQLVKRNLTGSFAAQTAGTVNLSNGGNLKFTANSMVRAIDNSTYTGTVNVFSATVNPTASNITAIMPGSLLAENSSGNSVILRSFGMYNVELEGSNGEKLQLQASKPAMITSPIANALQQAAPASIPLWYLDETTGLWKEDGRATRQGNNYVGEISHFTYWNFDDPSQFIFVTAKLLYPNGSAAANVQVQFIEANGMGSGGSFTDSLGYVRQAVPINKALTMSVNSGYPCYAQAFSTSLAAMPVNTDLGTINIPLQAATNYYELKGTVVDCNQNPLLNAVVQIRHLNGWQVMTTRTDAQGKFLQNFLSCNIPKCSVIAIDTAAQVQSATTIVNFTSNAANTGTIIACGTTLNEFMTYVLDGVTFTGINFNSNSGNAGNNETYHYVGSSAGNSKFLSLGFKTPANPSANVFAMEILTVADGNNMYGGVLPLNINLQTGVPTLGQFYVGNFTGQCRDSATNSLHAISGNFRIKRN